jgi:aspartate 1-decarboxylase
MLLLEMTRRFSEASTRGATARLNRCGDYLIIVAPVSNQFS